MEVGQREFRRNGFATIAENMPKWQEFLYCQFRNVEVKDALLQ
jgi:hypothetical protein